MKHKIELIKLINDLLDDPKDTESTCVDHAIGYIAKCEDISYGELYDIYFHEDH